ncbi:MAG TPA: GAF domain-containing protein [Streptosporangiaceae bacterium]|nr:GAF domain-containing protein [Streptosporangiaceae bacterium]
MAISKRGPMVVPALLEAVMGIGSDLELESVLRRITEAAVQLVDARYGALGVIGEDGKLAEFIAIGLDETEIGAVHHWPEGKGLLGERTFVGAPVQIRDTVYGSLYLTDKRTGQPFDEDDEALVVALAAAAGAAVDKARLYADARRRQRWLQAVAEVTRRLLSDAGTPEILSLITDLALELAGADLAVLALPARSGPSSGGDLIIEYASGGNAEMAIGLVLPAGASVSAARERLNLGPATVIPLGPPGSVRGVLTAGRRPGSRPLSPDAINMITTFAAQAGIGLELAGHRKDAERVAVFADRDRIARQLHDLVIQRLFATGMSLQAATAMMTDGPATARITHAVDALDDTIKDIRSSIFMLHNHAAPETPASLRIQIMTITDEITSALGFTPSLRLDGSLDTEVAVSIGNDMLIALREALSNVAKHAQASRVDVTVTAHTELVLVVQDNGQGISQDGRRSGLANLKHRAQALGGRLQLDQPQDGGTRLEWRVPLAISA